MRSTLGFLKWVDESPLYHDQATCWLFGTAGSCHILLTTALQNPTVRHRYLETRTLLDGYGHLDLYESLLKLQGSAGMGKLRVEYHLAAFTEIFDFAKEIIKPPHRFASDISEVGRPISIGAAGRLSAAATTVRPYTGLSPHTRGVWRFCTTTRPAMSERIMLPASTNFLLTSA
jgi:hypothetical protein